MPCPCICFYLRVSRLNFLDILEPPAAADVLAFVFRMMIRKRNGIVETGEGIAVAAPENAEANAGGVNREKGDRKARQNDRATNGGE